jgi:hypothetical protein
MTGITFPRSFEEFKNLKTRNAKIRPDYGELYSDITLTILTNKSNPIANIFFRDCYPNNISSIEFDTTNDDVVPVTATVTFIYLFYDIEILG